jgi:hypothetical protein
VRVTVCQLSDDPSQFERDWSALVSHARGEKADLVLLPEMPFIEWFAYVREYDETTWREAVRRHEEPAEKRVNDLNPAIVVGTRPGQSRPPSPQRGVRREWGVGDHRRSRVAIPAR